MTKLEPLAKFILSFEGGFANDPADAGGATNRGVTIATWKAQGYDKDGDGDIDVQDLKLITAKDATEILRKNFWNRWKADQIKSQAVANILVDWVWGSGKWGIVIPQRILGVKDDGIVGPKTLAVLNARDPHELFDKLKKRKAQYLEDICKTSLNKWVKSHGRQPTNSEKLKQTKYRFLKGWLRRNDAIKYDSLETAYGEIIKF